MAFQLYGVLVANANNVGQSVQGMFLLPSKNASCLGENRIYECNMKQSITLFCVRSIVKSNWINSNDVYLSRGIS